MLFKRRLDFVYNIASFYDDKGVISTSSRSCAALIWLTYCRYGVKHYPINQSRSCDIGKYITTLPKKEYNKFYNEKQNNI